MAVASQETDFFNVAYVEVNSNSFANVGCYTLSDGRQFFDAACIFAANINDDQGTPTLWFNPQVTNVLDGTDDVQILQDLGIKVLLTVLGNHEDAGWACFTKEWVAEAWVLQLVDCVDQYGLDGIDIDDEYSTCEPNDSSLVMVTDMMRQAMPGKIVSKALFDDEQYFGPTFGGNTLAQTLTQGWEMSYWSDDGAGRLAPYINAGMTPSELALGVSTIQTDPSAAQKLATYVKDNGVGGMMVYNVTNDSQDYLSTISQVLYGEDTIVKPNCVQPPTE